MFRKFMIRWLLSFIFIVSSSNLMAKESAILNAIASPKGVAIITFTYAITTGISNVLWGMNWTWLGASDQANSIVQAVGGLSAAAEAFILGAFIPIICYKYLQHKKKAHAERADTRADPEAGTARSEPAETAQTTVPIQTTPPIMWYYPSNPPYTHAVPPPLVFGGTGSVW